MPTGLKMGYINMTPIPLWKNVIMIGRELKNTIRVARKNVTLTGT